jgi:hypothetical protein
MKLALGVADVQAPHSRGDSTQDTASDTFQKPSHSGCIMIAALLLEQKLLRLWSDPLSVGTPDCNPEPRPEQ